MGGGVKCWGDNYYGQLGVNPGWTPVDVLAGPPEEIRPIIFIPGIGGSILKKPDKEWPLWPNLLEPDNNLETVVRYLLGEGLLDAVRLIMERMAGSADDLALDPDDDYTTDIFAPDVLRSIGPMDIYGSFLHDFLEEEQGYRPYEIAQLSTDERPGHGCDTSQAGNNPTLFVFPYDWRLPMERSSQRLANYVECVRTFHPNAQIDIVAHSMGGLVARRYILDKVNAGQPSHIRRMISLGTPG